MSAAPISNERMSGITGTGSCGKGMRSGSMSSKWASSTWLIFQRSTELGSLLYRLNSLIDWWSLLWLGMSDLLIRRHGTNRGSNDMRSRYLWREARYGGISASRASYSGASSNDSSDGDGDDDV